MSKETRKLIPPGLVYLADNITSKNNILGAPKEEKAKWAKDLNLPREMETIFFAGCGYQYTSELDSLMSLIRRAEKGGIGMDRLAGVASFQKKLGINPAGIYTRLIGKSGDSNAQPLRDAVKVLSNIGVDFGYMYLNFKNIAWYNSADEEIVVTYNNSEDSRVDLGLSGFRGKVELKRFFTW